MTHLFYFLFYLDGCFAWIHICIQLECLVPTQARRGQWIPSNWIYRWLWATICVLVIKPTSSLRPAGVLNCWAISPAQTASFQLEGTSVKKIFFFKKRKFNIRSWAIWILFLNHWCSHGLFIRGIFKYLKSTTVRSKNDMYKKLNCGFGSWLKRPYVESSAPL